MRHLLLFAASLLIFGSSLCAADAAKPNIVLIFADDLGYGDIGPFGSTKNRTPNLDQMANEGRRFTSFYATPVCSMSRACLMTGCYNARVSMPGVLFPRDNTGLHPDEATVAEVLKSAGYATACIGKWHLGHREKFLPTKQGFDSYFGIPYSNDMTIDPVNAKFAKDCIFRDGMTEAKARAQALPRTVPLVRGEEVVEYPADQDTLTKRYTAEAIKFIKEHQQQPFFLYLPHAMVHLPLAASSEFRGKSSNGLLGDAVEELDWSVGELLKTLKELNLDEKTLVIFTSDNGGAAGSSLPWRGRKGTQWEGGVREPCLMRWPGKIPAGTTTNQIAGNIDMLPTFTAITGASLPKVTLDGRDISPLMFTKDPPPVRDTHLYYGGNQQLAGIRQGDWKLLLTAPAANPNQAAKQEAKKEGKKQPAKQADPLPWLYNLADDPTETTNVAAKHPEIVAKLTAAAQAHNEELNQNKRPLGKVE
jgi:arylsulfatase A